MTTRDDYDKDIPDYELMLYLFDSIDKKDIESNDLRKRNLSLKDEIKRLSKIIHNMQKKYKSSYGDKLLELDKLMIDVKSIRRTMHSIHDIKTYKELE